MVLAIFMTPEQVEKLVTIVKEDQELWQKAKR